MESPSETFYVLFADISANPSRKVNIFDRRCHVHTFEEKQSNLVTLSRRNERKLNINNYDFYGNKNRNKKN